MNEFIITVKSHKSFNRMFAINRNQGQKNCSLFFHKNIIEIHLIFVDATGFSLSLRSQKSSNGFPKKSFRSFLCLAQKQHLSMNLFLFHLEVSFIMQITFYFMYFVKHDLKGLLKCLEVEIWTPPPHRQRQIGQKASQPVTDRAK